MLRLLLSLGFSALILAGSVAIGLIAYRRGRVQRIRRVYRGIPLPLLIPTEDLTSQRIDSVVMALTILQRLSPYTRALFMGWLICQDGPMPHSEHPEEIKALRCLLTALDTCVISRDDLCIHEEVLMEMDAFHHLCREYGVTLQTCSGMHGSWMPDTINFRADHLYLVFARSVIGHLRRLRQCWTFHEAESVPVLPREFAMTRAFLFSSLYHAHKNRMRHSR